MMIIQQNDGNIIAKQKHDCPEDFSFDVQFEVKDFCGELAGRERCMSKNYV